MIKYFKDLKLLQNTIYIRKHSKNLSLYLVASFITPFFGIIINPFLAINLTPEDYAIIGFFNSFNMLISPILSFSLISYYSRNYFRIKESDRQITLNTLVVSQLIIGFVGLIIVLIGFFIYVEITNVNFPFYPYAILCFLPIFLNCFYSLFLVEKRMKKQAFSFLKVVSINAILSTLFAILFVVILKRGAIGRFLSVLIPAIFLGFFSFFSLLSRFQFNLKIFKEAISFGWPISLSAILYYFLTGIDRVFLEQINDITTLGYYNVAIQITGYLYIFYSALIQTFEPDIYKAISENKRIRVFKIVIGIIALNALPVIIFILFANPVVRILTFGRYMASVKFTQILAIKNIAISFCFLISDVIIGYGYPKVELTNRIIGAGLSIISFKILIDKFGFYGAAWGQTIAFLIMTLISGSFVTYKILVRKGEK
ncbi:MAG TPA: oligosaccharide flippase family protein [Bacteroidales bacterium]|nr:oligosaccharide flippase family protein [Bacteroidales bacterium]